MSGSSDQAPSTTAAAVREPGGPTGPRPKKKAAFSFEDKQQVDYIRELTAKNVWYYRDRLSVPRGPCNLPVLRECWCAGVIDENTLIWGQGLGDWLPIKNVRTLVPQIRTLEVQVVTFIKKNFALKPGLDRIRRQRAGARVHKTSQINDMY